MCKVISVNPEIYNFNKINFKKYVQIFVSV